MDYALFECTIRKWEKKSYEEEEERQIRLLLGYRRRTNDPYGEDKTTFGQSEKSRRKTEEQSLFNEIFIFSGL